MYHLIKFEDKVKALKEAARVTKKGGVILVAYVMNEFSVITYGFKENNIIELIESGKIDENYRVKPGEDDLYDYVRLEDINRINDEVTEVERLKIISADGPADYLRPVLNKMDDKTYEQFIRYHLATCERTELLGASAHTVDILLKK